MNTLRSFLMDESGSASPKSGFASMWCICALVAVMTLFGALIQPAYADHHTCPTFTCCDEEIKDLTCPDDETCVGSACITWHDETCTYHAVCVLDE